MTSPSSSNPTSSSSTHRPPSYSNKDLGFLQWDEKEVGEWLSEQGYPQYSQLVLEENITGDSLPYLTPSTLLDLGIDKLGHRLGICRAIWGLKCNLDRCVLLRRAERAERRDGMEDDEEELVGWDWSEEDWRPADETMINPLNPSFPNPHSRTNTQTHSHSHSHSQSSTNSPSSISFLPQPPHPLPEKQIPSLHAQTQGLEERLWDVIMEQNERIAALEKEWGRLAGLLASQGSGGVGQGGYAGKEFRRNRERSDRDEDSDTLRGSRGLQPYRSVSSSQSQSQSQTQAQSSHLTAMTKHQPALSPSLQAQPSADPSTSTAPVPMTRGVASSSTQVTPPVLSRMMTSGTMLGVGEVGSPNLSPGSLGIGQPGDPSHSSSTSGRTGGTGLGRSGSTSRGPNHVHSGTENSLTHESGTPGRASSQPSNQTQTQTLTAHQKSAKDAASSAAKSFRVTLEDPCWKVLPAALKKYRIDDDWKMYAMFICFASTERCLSYDEKPLLLFQKLKEAGQKPVFMLRHLKDIQSPIAVAASKEATRRAHNRSVNHSTSSPNESKVSFGSGSTGTTLNAAAINAAANSGTPKESRSHRPPVLQPTSAQTRTAMTDGSGKTMPGSSTQGQFPDLPSPSTRGPLVSGQDKVDGTEKIGYAVAIYPYLADREDEFDVAVGSAFVILDKTKGWWVVHKDPNGTGDVQVDVAKSGWVPAGCMLETSHAIGPPKHPVTGDAGALSKQFILPGSIVSSSFRGIALMDYEVKGEDELTIKKDELLRVFKRYAHWSYSVKDTGERGWVPSWFIGKRGQEMGSAAATNTSASKASETTTDSVRQGDD